MEKPISDVPLASQIAEAGRVAQTTSDARAPDARPVTPRQIHALVAYYVALLIGSIALVTLLILYADLDIFSNDNKVADNTRRGLLLVRLGFLASGATVGSVLYQIRMLSKHYIKVGDFDSRWLSKYVTGPLEAIGLALAILSIVQSAGIVLGGEKFDLAAGRPFASFGFGALVGFGIREVVGWLANLAKTTFPSGGHET